MFTTSKIWIRCFPNVNVVIPEHLEIKHWHWYRHLSEISAEGPRSQFLFGDSITKPYVQTGKRWRMWTHTAQALGPGAATHNQEVCSRGQLGSHTKPRPKPSESVPQINLLRPVFFCTVHCSSSVSSWRRLNHASPICFFKFCIASALGPFFNEDFDTGYFILEKS